jgi:CelD/BcsL family acetyltransferase involved in cellulose biosynthesis
MRRITAIEEIGEEPPQALVAAWEELADAQRASPFLHPGFVLAWWRAFGRSPLGVAVTREGDRVVALLPLVMRNGVLASPANWHTPETGLLAADDSAAAELAVALLARRPRRLALAFLDGDAPATTLLRRAVAHDGYAVAERQLANAPYLELDGGDWEAFEREAIPAKDRRTLNRRARRLTEQGRVWLDVSDGREDAATLDARFDEVVRIEAMGWKGRQGTAMSSRQDTRAFYRAVAHWGAARGWLRMQVLRLDEAPLAVAFALEAHRVLYSMKTGYDPAHRSFGPGVMLMREVVRQGFEDGLERYELLGDEDPYKRMWSSGAHPRIALQAFAHSPRGRFDHFAFTRAAPLAKRLGAGRLRRVLPDRDRPRF